MQWTGVRFFSTEHYLPWILHNIQNAHTTNLFLDTSNIIVNGVSHSNSQMGLFAENADRSNSNALTMGLLPETQNCGLRMRRECRERFPRHLLQRKALVSDTGMRRGSYVRDARAVMHVGIANPHF